MDIVTGRRLWRGEMENGHRKRREKRGAPQHERVQQLSRKKADRCVTKEKVAVVSFSQPGQQVSAVSGIASPCSLYQAKIQSIWSKNRVYLAGF